MLINNIFDAHDGVIISIVNDYPFSGIGGVNNLSVSDVKSYMSTGRAIGGIADNISRLDFTIVDTAACVFQLPRRGTTDGIPVLCKK